MNASAPIAANIPDTIHRIGHGSEVRLLIPELESGRHPDVAVAFRGAPRNARGHLMPALVVEVVSPGKTGSQTRL